MSIQSLSPYCHLPGTVPGTGKTAGKKTKKTHLFPQGFHSSGKKTTGGIVSHFRGAKHLGKKQQDGAHGVRNFK